MSGMVAATDVLLVNQKKWPLGWMTRSVVPWEAEDHVCGQLKEATQRQGDVE